MDTTATKVESGLESPGEHSLTPIILDFEENDRENPRTWSLLFKWFCNITAALTMMTGTFAISSYVSGLGGMKKEFGVSSELLAVGQTLFLDGAAVGSLFFPGTADYFGRKRVIVLTMAMFTCFSIGVSEAKNIATVLVCRFFSGLFASAGQALIPAQVSAIFLPHELAVPFTVAAIAPFLGPSMGPLLGGFVVQYSGSWRNIDRLAMAMAGLFTIIYLIFIPETFSPYILRKRAARREKETGLVHVSIFDKGGRKTVKAEFTGHILRPIIYLFTEPIVFIFTLYVSFLYGILNLFFEAFPVIYQEERHWTLGNAGLPFVALLCGFIVSIPMTAICGIPYKRALARDGKAAPELRLVFAMLSSVLLPISLFWMGWAGNPKVSWVAPVIAGGLFGFCQIGLQMAVFIYLVDVYGMTVGAAIAALNTVRFGLSSIFPLFAAQMYHKLGVGWASSVLGFILVAFLPAPFLFYRFGPSIRAKSKTARL